MSPFTVVLLLAAGFLLAVCAGFIAAAETAFTRISRTRADALAAVEAEDHPDSDDADERVALLQRFSKRPLTTLASLTLGQLLCQVGAASISFAVGRQSGAANGDLLAVAICLIVLFIIVTLSRSWALLAPDATAIGLVPIMRAVAPLGWVTSGIVGLARRSLPSVVTDPDVDEQQVLALVDQTTTIDEVEGALIKRVVAFDDTLVGDIMTPRPDVVTLRSGFAVGAALEVASLHGLSRLPVTGSDSDIDDIIGAVHVKDLILAHIDGRTDRDIDRWLRDVPVVPETQRIANLLKDLKTGDLHLAIVVDEHGGVAGVVSLEDVLEEIVGEIEDEFDRPEPALEMIDPYTVRTDGRVEIDRLEQVLGITLPPGDYRTVAGCVFSGLGRVPDVGDVLMLDELDLEFKVVRMHGRRIADLELSSTEPFEVQQSPLDENSSS